MPIYNFTIDDASPFISYSDGWSDTVGTNNPPQIKYYLGRTVHVTSKPGSSATVSFNGTGIFFYGAKRSNYGAFTVTVDGNSASPGSAQGNEDIPTLLFAKPDLTYGLHHIIFTSTDPQGLDLDYVNITTGDGQDSTYEDTKIIDDVDFQYVDGGAKWMDTNTFAHAYDNSTLHVSQSINAAATVSFTGNAIKLYSALNSDHGPFSVSLDGAKAINLTGKSSDFRPKTLLYQFDGLPDGDHLLRIENLAAQWLDLDKAVVSTYAPSAVDKSSTTNTPASGSSTASPTSDSGGSKATANEYGKLGLTLALIAVGVLILLIAVGLAVLYRRRRVARRYPGDLEPRLQQQSGRTHPVTHTSYAESDTIAVTHRTTSPILPRSPPSYSRSIESLSATAAPTRETQAPSTRKPFGRY